MTNETLDEMREKARELNTSPIMRDKFDWCKTDLSDITSMIDFLRSDKEDYLLVDFGYTGFQFWASSPEGDLMIEFLTKLHEHLKALPLRGDDDGKIITIAHDPDEISPRLDWIKEDLESIDEFIEFLKSDKDDYLLVDFDCCGMAFWARTPEGDLLIEFLAKLRESIKPKIVK